MAEVRTVELKVDTKQAVKSLDELGGTFEDVYGEIQPLSGRIGELEDRLYEMSLAGEQNTDEFKKLTKEIGSMKKVIIETDLLVDGMSQTMAQNVGGAIGGITSGFALAQGSMAAFGVESAAVEETLLRVQSAMAISEGFQGIRESVASFKGLAANVKLFGQNTLNSVKALSTFKKALIGTGIGALVVILGELIANWDKYKKVLEDFSLTLLEKVIPSQKEEINQLQEIRELGEQDLEQSQQKLKALEKEIQATKNASAIENQKYDDAIRLAIAEGKSKEEIERLERKKLETIIKSAETELALQKEKALALRDEIKAKAALGQLDDEAREAALEALRSQIETTKSTYQTLKSARVDLAVFEAEKETEKRQAGKESAKQKIEEEKALADEIKRIQEEEALRQIEEEEELSEFIRRAKLTSQQKELEDINTHYFNLIERAKQYGLDTLALEEEQSAKLKEVNDRYAAEEEARKAEAEQKAEDERKQELQDELDLQNAKFEAAAVTLQGISGLVNAFAGESEAQQRRAFNISKAINIAQAVMDTYKGANAIFANAAINPQTILFPAQPFIMAGAAIAAGLANVATIAKQKFNGGGGSAVGTGSAPTAPTIGGGSSPAQFNVVGNNGVNQLAQTLGDQPMKAYVVAGDVTTAQSLERNKIEQGTL